METYSRGVAELFVAQMIDTFDVKCDKIAHQQWIHVNWPRLCACICGCACMCWTCICAFAKPSQAKPWRAGITMKIRIFLLVPDSVLIEQCTMHDGSSMVEKRVHNAISHYLRALDKYDREGESCSEKAPWCEDVGVRDSWKNLSTRICVGVCVWVYSCDCERAYVQVYLEKVKSECRKITLRNQNATMMASLCWMNSIVDRWMDGWCFYLM